MPNYWGLALSVFSLVFSCGCLLYVLSCSRSVHRSLENIERMRQKYREDIDA